MDEWLCKVSSTHTKLCIFVVHSLDHHKSQAHEVIHPFRNSNILRFYEYINVEQYVIWDFVAVSCTPLFPFPFLKYCAISLNSFGGKGINLRRWIIDGFPAEVFFSSKTNVRRSVHSSYRLPIEVTDMILGACGLWLGTGTGAGGTATLT